MNSKVHKGLALLLTLLLAASLGACKPITNSIANAPYYGANNTASDIVSDSESSWDFSISSDAGSSSAASSGDLGASSEGGGKGNQIIVDDSDDVGAIDDPELSQRPNHEGAGEDKPMGDTIVVKPGGGSSSSGAVSSAGSSQTPSSSGGSSSGTTTSTEPPVSSAGSSSSGTTTSSEESSSSSTSTRPESNVSSGAGSSAPSSSSAVSSSKPPFNPPDNQWYDYEGKRYLYQNGKPVTGYQRINGLTYFFEQDGSVSSKVGIDVSSYQGDIDWNKVKAAGVEYAIIRIGIRGYGSAGNFKKDPKFLQNIVNATSVGIDCGVYFFTQAITKAEAEEEARKVIEWIKEAKTEKDAKGNLVWPKENWKYLNYPIYFDTELSTSPTHTGRADKLTKSQRTETVIGFCETLKKEKYYPGIYANTDWLKNRIDMSRLQSYDVWVAHYGVSKPGYTGKHQMWQYSSTGKINGITGNVDLNVGLFDYAPYISKNGWNHLNEL